MEDSFTVSRAELPGPVIMTPIVTYVLIVINILIYLFDQYISAKMGTPILFILGSKFSPLIIQGEYWRLITPIFLHGGLMHLAVNAYSLYAVGPDVEKMFGHVKFVVIYLVAGILGNVASFAFCPSVSISASGAIFGLLGALLYVGIKYKEVISSLYVTNIVFMIVLNLTYGFLHPRIDNYAHLGGLVGGYLSAFCLGLGSYNRGTQSKVLAFLLLVVLTAVGIFIGFVFPIAR